MSRRTLSVISALTLCCWAAPSAHAAPRKKPRPAAAEAPAEPAPAPPPAAATPAPAEPAPAAVVAAAPTPAPPAQQAVAPAAAPAPAPAPPAPAAPPASPVAAPTSGASALQALAGNTPPSATAAETIALLPITAPEVGLGSTATAQVAQGLRDMQVFKVMDPETIASLLGGEALRQSCGAADNSCLAELAGAVGAQFYVSGSISRVGTDYTINLVLTDQKTAQNVDGVIRTERSASDVGPGIRLAAQRVVQKLLAGKQGTLRLVMSETNADVKLDDVLVGTTPLAPRQLPMGPHKVSVEKSGFIAYRQEVLVRAGETTVMSGALIPNQEYIDGYRRKNLALRAAGAGAVLLTAIPFIASPVLYGLYWAVLAAGIGTDKAVTVFATPPWESPTVTATGVPTVLTVIMNVLLVAWVISIPVVLLALPTGWVTGLALWFFSEDPGRYSQYSG